MIAVWNGIQYCPPFCSPTIDSPTNAPFKSMIWFGYVCHKERPSCCLVIVVRTSSWTLCLTVLTTESDSPEPFGSAGFFEGRAFSSGEAWRFLIRESPCTASLLTVNADVAAFKTSNGSDWKSARTNQWIDLHGTESGHLASLASTALH